MTKNITLTLEEAVLRKARHAAVEQDQSVSEWVANLVIREVSQKELSNSARKRALQRLKTGFRLGGRTFSREELHER